MSEQKQKFCCTFFEQSVKLGEIITKEELFSNINDIEFLRIHPKYVIRSESGKYLGFNFCSNCGFKYSTDEQIEYWNKIYKIKNKDP